MTNYELWQMERFGNIVAANGVEEIENGAQDAQDQADWVDRQAEQELFTHS